MQSPAPRARKEATLGTRRDELKTRAKLLARLGYTQTQAVTRLTQNLAWEYERVGAPKVKKELAGLVAEAFVQAGVVKGTPAGGSKKKRS